jgi:PA-IL-like protein
MRKQILLGLALLSLGLAPILVNADTLRLKNGTVIKGKVVGFSGGSFTVALDLGGSSSQSRAIIDVSDVEAIEFDGREANRDQATIRETPRTSTAPTTPPRREEESRPPVSNKPSVPVTTPVSTRNNSNSSAKELNATVSAKEDWTYANVIIRRGDRIKLNATGKVKISPNRESGPEGVELDDKGKLLLDRPTGALIAVIGDDNDDFIFVGRDGEFVAPRDGKLFLSVNEGDLSDNTGTFNVKVKIEPSR